MGRKQARRGFDIYVYTADLDMPKTLILIVEDNEKNLKLMRDLLQFKGFNTIEARTAEQGIELALESNPALILMDIQLPGMNGIEALHKLRSQPATTDIPVIAVTASVAVHDEKELTTLGFNEYQSKPIDINAFMKCIEQTLSPNLEA